MNDVPRISGAEWEIMHVVWDRHPVTAHEVADELGDQKGWTLATIKTLLARLLKKNALSFELDGKKYLYRPAVSRESCIQAESDSFLHRVFNGSTSPLVTHFLQRGSLSTDEIDRLRELLRSLEEKP